MAEELLLVPAALVAVTVNVYAVPLVKPVTVIGDEPPVALKPPVFEVTVYEVIADPPLLAGALNVIVACPFPAVAVPIVGAPGTVAGTTALLVFDEILVPTLFVAVTVNVYVVPFVNPVTVIGDDPPVALNPPVFEVTVYVVIDAPPLLLGGVNEIVACPLPDVAVTEVGASGVVAGVTELLLADALLVPTPFVAVTVNVYVVPFVSPVTISGDDPPVAVNPPVLDVTVYEVIVELPSLAGGVKVIVACPLPRVAVPIVGASGTVAGETVLLALEAILVPTLFVAVIVKLYAVPFARPVTTIGELLPVAVKPPTLEVTV